MHTNLSVCVNLWELLFSNTYANQIKSILASYLYLIAIKHMYSVSITTAAVTKPQITCKIQIPCSCNNSLLFSNSHVTLGRPTYNTKLTTNIHVHVFYKTHKLNSCELWLYSYSTSILFIFCDSWFCLNHIATYIAT